MNVLIAGDPALAHALEPALAGLEVGVQGLGQRTIDTATALVASEEALQENAATVAVSLGVGDTALALAITAAKRDVRLGCLLASESEAATAAEMGSRRAILMLAECVVEVGENGSVDQAAATLAAWANLESDR